MMMTPSACDSRISLGRCSGATTASASAVQSRLAAAARPLEGLPPALAMQDPLFQASIRKSFGGQWFEGQVACVDVDSHSGERAYHIIYHDGDEEHLLEGDVRRWLVHPVRGVPATPRPSASISNVLSAAAPPRHSAPAPQLSFVSWPKLLSARSFAGAAASIFIGVWVICRCWDTFAPTPSFGALDSIANLAVVNTERSWDTTSSEEFAKPSEHVAAWMAGSNDEEEVASGDGL